MQETRNLQMICKSTRSARIREPGTLLRAIGLCGGLLVLAGCGPDRLATGSIVPEDLQARHPIVVGEAPVVLTVLPNGGRLDHNSQARVAQFGREYRQEGDGRLEILLPVGGFDERAARAALPAIKSALAAGGAQGAVSVGSYPVADPKFASPIRLSYRGVRARVLGRCGEWPADLASGSSLQGWENRPYWNYGCAYQSMMAAQVDDPRDLVEPRATTPSDVEMRTRAITKVRQGADPSTTWIVKNTDIGNVGGK